MSWGFYSSANKYCSSKVYQENNYLIHNPEDDLLVIPEPSRKFAPELSKLFSGGSGRVTGITDDAPGHWLLRRIVVSHVVMRVQDAVSSLLDSDVVNRILEFGEVLGKG